MLLRVFIASSHKQMGLANRLKQSLNLAPSTGVAGISADVWTDDGIFPSGDVLWKRLTEIPDDYDFGLFIFGKDDVAEVDGKTVAVVRDNVIFEMGLMVGALGSSRALVVYNRDDAPRVPTDFQGLLRMDFSRDDLAPICDRLVEHFRKVGPVFRRAYSVSQEHAHDVFYELLRADKVDCIKHCSLTERTGFANGRGYENRIVSWLKASKQRQYFWVFREDEMRRKRARDLLQKLNDCGVDAQHTLQILGRHMPFQKAANFFILTKLRPKFQAVISFTETGTPHPAYLSGSDASVAPYDLIFDAVANMSERFVADS